MANSYHNLISPTGNAELEVALREKLLLRSQTTGELGELEPLAVRLGLIQKTLKPRFHAPQIVVFAADHGIAVGLRSHVQAGQPHGVIAIAIANLKKGATADLQHLGGLEGEG